MGSELREVNRLINFSTRTQASDCVTGTAPNLFFFFWSPQTTIQLVLVSIAATPGNR